FSLLGKMRLGYLEIYLNGTRLDFSITGTAQPKLTQAAMNKIVVPVASVAEQEQIVAEVEEHLSVIAATEKQINESLRRAARLRQSILKRAFEGKLVPQDPDDEPADKLLGRIRQERATANGRVAPRPRRGRAASRKAGG